MIYLAECEQDKNLPADQQKHLRDLTIAEIRLRNKRLALMKLEQEWNI